MHIREGEAPARVSRTHLIGMGCVRGAVARWKLTLFIRALHSWQFAAFSLLSAAFFEPSMMKSSSSTRAPCKLVLGLIASPVSCNLTQSSSCVPNNNKTIWRGSVLTGEESALPLWGVESCCPALCRQDTTTPWSTDYGGNKNSNTNARSGQKKEKRPQRGYLLPPATPSSLPRCFHVPRRLRTNVFFTRNVVRNREAIEAKKIRF